MIKVTTISKLMLVLILTVMLAGNFTSLLAQTPGTLYASTGNAGGTLITVDPTTGAGTLVASIGTFGPVTEIEFRSDGVLFGATGQQTNRIITINPLTGAEDTIGTHANGSVNGLEFDQSGDLFGAFFEPPGANPSAFLVVIDQSTGQFITTLGDIGWDIVTGLAFSPSGILFGVGHSIGSNQSALFKVDTTTGLGDYVGDTGFFVGAIEFGPNGVLYGGVGSLDGTSAGHLITIDTTTGAGVDVGPTGSPAISGLSFVPPPTSIGNGNDGNVPDQFLLEQSYPNPFNPVTHIGFRLPGASDVKIEVFDILGNKVATLLDSHKSAGNHTVDFDAVNLASGLYLYRIQAGEFVQMKKMVLMK